MARENEVEHQEQGQGLGLHLALLPIPFQGHMTPMLQLANLLHSKGFSVTIIYLQLYSPPPSNQPNLKFQPIFPDQPLSFRNKIEFISSLNTNFQGPIRDCLLHLQRENPLNPVSCLIVDLVMYITQGVAQELELPWMVLNPSSSISLLNYPLHRLIMQRGYFSIQDNQLELSPVPELLPLRVKDLLKIYPNIEASTQSQFFDIVVNATRSATALILNSSDHLEHATIPELRREFPIPVFPVGPLYKSSPEFSTNLLEQDQSCLAWLDRQVPKTVLYVSFGSAVQMEEKELVEIAWGLANSDQPFLLVVRPGLVAGLEGDWPQVFVERIGGRGCIVKWAPQQQVLAHPAVGGFLTHCGWNSTLESISEGVPMICMARLVDQPGNARLVSCVWKVGLVLEGDVLGREEIERVVRRLMVGEEGEKMRERSRALKENVEMCVGKGGSTYESIDKLVNLILSL